MVGTGEVRCALQVQIYIQTGTQRNIEKVILLGLSLLSCEMVQIHRKGVNIYLEKLL